MINKSWDNVLREEYHKDYFKKLRSFVKEEYKSKKIYPKYENIFKAFNLTSYEDVKVVILGQDPYFHEGQAEGLCFSVPNNIAKPPSLKNIFNELYSDLKIFNNNSSLEEWAKQGVFLLNTILTVEDGKPLSHQNKGWEKFTDAVIKKVSEKETPVVFLLWGRPAWEKEKIISKNNNLILKSTHPSPLSANKNGKEIHSFMGCRHFSKTNEFLIEKKISPINFKLN